MSWEQAEYELKHPIEIDGIILEKITLKMPNGAGLLQIEDMGFTDKDGDFELSLRETVALVEIFAWGAPKGFTSQMHVLDIKGAAGVMAPLLELLFKMGEDQEAENQSSEQSSNLPAGSKQTATK